MPSLNRVSSIIWEFRSRHIVIAIKNSLFCFILNINTSSFNLEYSSLAGGVTKQYKVSRGQWQHQANERCACAMKQHSLSWEFAM